jgi:hypothetical protein
MWWMRLGVTVVAITAYVKESSIEVMKRILDMAQGKIAFLPSAV